MAYQSVFNEIDTDRSGTIEKHELFRYLSRKFPGQYTSYDLDVMMYDADLNQDGRLSYDEFRRVMEKSDRRWSPLFTNFHRSSFQTAQYLHNFAFTVVEPLHVLSRRHSYLHDDMYVASTAVRVFSSLITWFLYWFLRASVYGVLTELFYNNSTLERVYHTPGLLFAFMPQSPIYNSQFIFFFEFICYVSSSNIALFICGLQLVDNKTKHPFPTYTHLVHDIISIFLWPLECYLLMHTGKTLAQRLCSGLVTTTNINSRR